MMMNVQGNGIFNHSDNYQFESNFMIELDLIKVGERNRTHLSSEINDLSVVKKLYNLPFYPWTLEGKTSQGENVSAYGMALVTRGESIDKDIKINLGFNYNELMIGNQTNYTKVEYFIPNMIIGFDYGVEENRQFVRNKSTFELTFRDKVYLIEIKGMNEIVTRGREIRMNNEELITVRITITKKGEIITYDESKELISHVLDLCTIAYGDRVNWSHAYGYNEDKLDFKVIRNVQFCKFNPFRQLLRVSHPYVLSQFIKNSFHLYSSFSDEKRLSLRKLIEGIRFSDKRLIFPAPFVNLGSTIEEYAGQALQDNVSHYVSKSIRRNLAPTFQKWLEANVFLHLNQEDQGDFDESGLKQKLSQILTRNLRSRITNLLESYGIEYENEWIGSFVKKRNSGSHGTYLFSSEDFLIWSRMATYLEQIIFEELKYKGEYLDWTTSPPEWDNIC